MLRDRLRAIARLKTSGTDKNNSFRQSILLIFIGALISFGSLVITSVLNSKSESKKLILEQKVAFEKDVVGCISSNIFLLIHSTRVGNQILSLKNMGGYHDPYNGKFDTTLLSLMGDKYDSSVIRSIGIQLLMNSYVDYSISDRFRYLDSSISRLYADEVSLFGQIQQNRIPHDAATSLLEIYTEHLSEYRNEFGDFMHDFHADIFK